MACRSKNSARYACRCGPAGRNRYTIRPVSRSTTIDRESGSAGGASGSDDRPYRRPTVSEMPRRCGGMCSANGFQSTFTTPPGEPDVEVGSWVGAELVHPVRPSAPAATAPTNRVVVHRTSVGDVLERGVVLVGRQDVLR